MLKLVDTNAVQVQNFTITTEQVEAILAMREQKEALKSRLELLENSLKARETEIIAALENGAPKNCGYAIAVQSQTRRVPKWKEEFMARLGREEAELVTLAAPETIIRKLVIS